jgi:signal transduction histidine kinase
MTRSPLDRAAARVRSDPAVWAAHSLDRATGEQRLDEIVAAVAADRAADSSGHGLTPADKALCRQLIDLVRRELLADDAAGMTELLALLRRLEALRSGLEPEWHQALATALAGVDALDLVVELGHDIRSPLTSIMFLAEALRRSPGLGTVERQQLGIIYSAALNLADMASNLIDLALDDAAPGPGALAPFSVARVLERVRGMLAPMAEEKGVELVLEGPAHDGRIGDGVALSRILLNLTTNALKFTEAGQVSVRAEELGDAALEFSVTDTGPGMDEEMVATLFEPFRRSRSRTGFRLSGTGLGLAICRRMLEGMGSSLEVASRPGAGSRFSFRVDLPRSEG